MEVMVETTHLKGIFKSTIGNLRQLKKNIETISHVQVSSSI